MVSKICLVFFWIGLIACDAGKPKEQPRKVEGPKQTVSFATLRVCNTAPYQVKYVVYYPKTSSEGWLTAWSELQAGQCQNISAEFHNVDPALYVYGESSGAERILRVIHGIPPDDLEPLRVTWKGTDIYQCVTNVQPPGWQGDTQEKSCPASKERLGFTRVKERNGQTWHFQFSDPKLLWNPQKEKVFEEVLKETTSYVQMLHKALQRQVAFQEQGYGHKLSDTITAEERLRLVRGRRKLHQSAGQEESNFSEGWAGTWHGKAFPFSLGAEVYDPFPDGHLRPGVVLGEVAPQTIFGDPMPFQAGDVLETFNGEVVFSAADLYILLQEHATSRAKGIQVPFAYSGYRGNTPIKGVTTYFFNEQFWGASKEDALFTALFATEDVLALGANAFAHCTGKNIGTFFLNGARWGTNLWIEQLNKDFQLDWKELEYYQYEQPDDCRWRTNQYIARLMQKNLDFYTNVAFIGYMTPYSGIRLVFASNVERYMVRNMGSQVLGQVAANMALETLETTGSIIIGASPGASRADVVREVKTFAPIAAGFGFVQGILSRR
ncbi:MAG: DUF1036 domain-containing protein [Nitrospira sp.]|nr:DUF1036 domain-containing protein [Nitrospira sp.]